MQHSGTASLDCKSEAWKFNQWTLHDAYLRSLCQSVDQREQQHETAEADRPAMQQLPRTNNHLDNTPAVCCLATNNGGSSILQRRVSNPSDLYLKLGSCKTRNLSSYLRPDKPTSVAFHIAHPSIKFHQNPSTTCRDKLLLYLPFS